VGAGPAAADGAVLVPRAVLEVPVADGGALGGGLECRAHDRVADGTAGEVGEIAGELVEVDAARDRRIRGEEALPELGALHPSRLLEDDWRRATPGQRRIDRRLEV